MKRTARRETVRRRFLMPVLLAAALLVFLGGIAAGGSGTPDPNLIGRENPSAQPPDPTESAPQPDPTLNLSIGQACFRRG